MLFSGIFPALKSEDEIAALLAREIAHVLCGHPGEECVRTSIYGLIYLPLVPFFLVGLRYRPLLAIALTPFAVVADYTSDLSFSKNLDREADSVGQLLMAEAGYDPNALTSVLTKLKEAEVKRLAKILGKDEDSYIAPEFMSALPYVSLPLLTYFLMLTSSSLRPGLCRPKNGHRKYWKY